jgi:signal peptidase II
VAWLELLFTAAAVLLADQVSKWIVAGQPQWHEAKPIRPFVSIRYVLNRRMIVASRAGAPILLVIWIFVVAAGVLLLQHGSFSHSRIASMGFGMILGGITGNLIDLMRVRAVIDFIAIGSWPVFNIADAAAVVGFGLLLLAMR